MGEKGFDTGWQENSAKSSIGVEEGKRVSEVVARLPRKRKDAWVGYLHPESDYGDRVKIYGGTRFFRPGREKTPGLFAGMPSTLVDMVVDEIVLEERSFDWEKIMKAKKLGGSSPSPFLSFTKDRKVAREFAGDNGFIFEAYVPRKYLFGSDHIFKGKVGMFYNEGEVSLLGRLRPEWVMKVNSVHFSDEVMVSTYGDCTSWYELEVLIGDRVNSWDLFSSLRNSDSNEIESNLVKIEDMLGVQARMAAERAMAVEGTRNEKFVGEIKPFVLCENGVEFLAVVDELIERGHRRWSGKDLGAIREQLVKVFKHEAEIADLPLGVIRDEVLRIALLEDGKYLKVSELYKANVWDGGRLEKRWQGVYEKTQGFQLDRFSSIDEAEKWVKEHVEREGREDRGE